MGLFHDTDIPDDELSETQRIAILEQQVAELQEDSHPPRNFVVKCANCNGNGKIKYLFLTGLYNKTPGKIRGICDVCDGTGTLSVLEQE